MRTAHSPARIPALDGLRGVAALTVVIHHCMLVSPLVMTAFTTPLSTGDLWAWAAVHTPLHLLWGGDEAVVVFFVLSGFVLTLPALTGPARWGGYFVRRLVRLYLPVWASLALAAATIAVIPRTATTAQTDWVQDRVVQATPGGAAVDATLAFTEVPLNGVLWSLHYELLFSLLLPLYLAGALVLRRWWWAKLAVLVVLTAVGSLTDIGALQFMPVFGVGVVLAVEREQVGRTVRDCAVWQWAVLFTAAGVLMMIRWWGAPGYVPTATVAAAVLVVGLQWSSNARRVGETGVAQWLGKLSFSLYLVHEPILVAVVVATAATTPWLPLLVGVPLSLAAAAAMYVLVERPAHRLARRAGRLVESRSGQLRTGPTGSAAITID